MVRRADRPWGWLSGTCHRCGRRIHIGECSNERRIFDAIVGETSDMEGLTAGRIVHYVLNEGHNVGQCRPAIVVRTWGDPPTAPYPIQLQVFVDGTNDWPGETVGHMWRTSVVYDDRAAGERQRGTWHWIEKA